jgi:hypothetical protein
MLEQFCENLPYQAWIFNFIKKWHISHALATVWRKYELLQILSLRERHFLQKSKKRLFIFISISLEIVENQTDCKARKRYRLKICEIL